MIELQKQEAEADRKSKEEKDGKADNARFEKNIESLLRRMEKCENKNKDLVTEDASEQK